MNMNKDTSAKGIKRAKGTKKKQLKPTILRRMMDSQYSAFYFLGALYLPVPIIYNLVTELAPFFGLTF